MTRAAVGARALRQHHVRAHRLAQVRLVAQAEEAVAARGRERRDHAVADRDAGHVAAHREHGARALVAEDDRRRQRHVAVGEAQVGVAHAAGVDVHEHVVRADRPASATSSITNGSLYAVRMAARMVPPWESRVDRSRAGCRIRTDDIFFTREVLCHLS